jgi:hypothetical protein
MTRRYVATLSLLIWYLMVPPPGGMNAPLPAWTIIAAFDSPDACNRELQDRQRATQERGTKNRRAVEPSPLRFAQCVSSDDPRLNPD